VPSADERSFFAQLLMRIGAVYGKAEELTSWPPMTPYPVGQVLEPGQW